MGQIRTAPTHCHGKAPLFDLLSAGTQHGIKGVLQVAKPLNALDGVLFWMIAVISSRVLGGCVNSWRPLDGCCQNFGSCFTHQIAEQEIVA